LWTPFGSRDGHYDYVLAEADATVPAHTFNPLMLVSREQGMLVLPQTTKNLNNDTKVNTDAGVGDGTGDFYLSVSYQVSNYYDELKIPFSDLNGLKPTVANEGLTFEMGRQYALTLSFAENEAGGPVGVKFQLEVEDWDGKTEAYAATTVVFAENKPEDVTDELTVPVHAPNSGFIYGKELPELATAPTLDGWIFLGYFDADGKKYYDADLNSVDGVTWDKVDPSCTLYAHWGGEEPYPFWAQSNIYFKPDNPIDPDCSVGSLTFLEKGATTEQKGYQGLYFKWGSLIGVSPVGSAFEGATYLYIPNVKPDVNYGKYYKVLVSGVKELDAVDAVKDFYTVSDWVGTGNQGTPNDWSRIPYATSGDIDASYTQRNDHRLTDNSADLYQYYKGDICKFLSDTKSASKLTRNWVMPTSNKWDAVDGNYNSGYSTNYKWYPGSLNNTTPDGTDESDVYLTYTTTTGEEVTFPASGDRGSSNGALYSVGSDGFYWSGSVPAGSDAFNLFFTNKNVYPAGIEGGRAFGRSVRCVQN
jgi:hypothetical protein